MPWPGVAIADVVAGFENGFCMIRIQCTSRASKKKSTSKKVKTRARSNQAWYNSNVNKEKGNNMLTQILNNLNNFTDTELRTINSAVVDQLKANRNREVCLKRHTLKAGDRVTWNGRNGHTEGTIVRIKRKKAICSVGFGADWDVPLSMLTAA